MASICYSFMLMYSSTLTISELAADWHKLMVQQHTIHCPHGPMVQHTSDGNKTKRLRPRPRPRPNV